jgi:hypothetical protein
MAANSLCANRKPQMIGTWLFKLPLASRRRQFLPHGGFDHRGAFSAIMIVGALVLVEVTTGITEASMTRGPSRPRTRNSSSTR